MSLEFHCHTLFSIDGSGTPEALVEAAAARGVVALAITEHNHLGSAARAAARAAELGIGCLVSGGSDCHHAPGAPPREIGGCVAPDPEGIVGRLAEALARKPVRR